MQFIVNKIFKQSSIKFLSFFSIARSLFPPHLCQSYSLSPSLSVSSSFTLFVSLILFHPLCQSHSLSPSLSVSFSFTLSVSLILFHPLCQSHSLSPSLSVSLFFTPSVSLILFHSLFVFVSSSSYSPSTALHFFHFHSYPLFFLLFFFFFQQSQIAN